MTYHHYNNDHYVCNPYNNDGYIDRYECFVKRDRKEKYYKLTASGELEPVELCSDCPHRKNMYNDWRDGLYY